MLDAIRRWLPEYTVQAVTEQNARQFMDVYETNRDYFILTGGETARELQILDDMKQLPPHFPMDKKWFLGFWINGAAAAVMDVLEGYPNPACCWIGLLLVHQDLQGKGTGSAIVTALGAVCRETGHDAIRLGVVAENVNALRFWEKAGFITISEQKTAMGDKTDCLIYVMEKRVGGSGQYE